MEVGTAVTPLIIPFLFIKINQIMFLFKKKKKSLCLVLLCIYRRFNLKGQFKKTKTFSLILMQKNNSKHIAATSATTRIL